MTNEKPDNLTPFYCAKCGAVLGHCSPTALWIDGNEFFIAIKWTHDVPGCRGRNRFVPEKPDWRLYSLQDTAKAHAIN
jgi:hypothetical protein